MCLVWPLEVELVVCRVHRKRREVRERRSAAVVQRVYRGFCGRVRHARRRILRTAALEAERSVAVKYLYPSDLKELSEVCVCV